MKMYIEVLRNGGIGFWEINTETNKALFRDYDHKREGEPMKGAMIHDWEELYSTIEQFLKENLKMKYVKEIIPDVKYLFSEDTPFCEWFTDGVVAHDPARKIHCTKPATVLKHGVP